MGESQKIKHLWLPSPAGRVPVCESSELDQLRLARLYLQMELAQPRSQFLQKPRGLLSILKACQKIVRIPEIVGFSSTGLPKYPLEPQVQGTV